MDAAALRRNKAEAIKIDLLSTELGSYEDRADSLEDAYLDLCDRVAILTEDILSRKHQREATSSATGMLLKGDRAFDEKLKSAVRKSHLLKDEIGRLKRNENETDMKNRNLRIVIDNKRHQRIRNEIKLKEYGVESQKISREFADALKSADNLTNEIEQLQLRIESIYEKDEMNSHRVNDEMEKLNIIIMDIRSERSAEAAKRKKN